MTTNGWFDNDFYNIDVSNSSTQAQIASFSLTTSLALLEQQQKWQIGVARFRVPLTGVPLTQHNIPFQRWRVGLGFTGHPTAYAWVQQYNQQSGIPFQYFLNSAEAGTQSIIAMSTTTQLLAGSWPVTSIVEMHTDQKGYLYLMASGGASITVSQQPTPDTPLAIQWTVTPTGGETAFAAFDVNPATGDLFVIEGTTTPRVSQYTFAPGPTWTYAGSWPAPSMTSLQPAASISVLPQSDVLFACTNGPQIWFWDTGSFSNPAQIVTLSEMLLPDQVVAAGEGAAARASVVSGIHYDDLWAAENPGGAFRHNPISETWTEQVAIPPNIVAGPVVLFPNTVNATVFAFGSGSSSLLYATLASLPTGAWSVHAGIPSAATVVGLFTTLDQTELYAIDSDNYIWLWSPHGDFSWVGPISFSYGLVPVLGLPRNNTMGPSRQLISLFGSGLQVNVLGDTTAPDLPGFFPRVLLFNRSPSTNTGTLQVGITAPNPLGGTPTYSAVAGTVAGTQSTFAIAPGFNQSNGYYVCAGFNNFRSCVGPDLFSVVANTYNFNGYPLGFPGNSTQLFVHDMVGPTMAPGLQVIPVIREPSGTGWATGLFDGSTNVNYGATYTDTNDQMWGFTVSTDHSSAILSAHGGTGEINVWTLTTGSTVMTLAATIPTTTIGGANFISVSGLYNPAGPGLLPNADPTVIVALGDDNVVYQIQFALSMGLYDYTMYTVTPLYSRGGQAFLAIYGCTSTQELYIQQDNGNTVYTFDIILPTGTAVATNLVIPTAVTTTNAILGFRSDAAGSAVTYGVTATVPIGVLGINAVAESPVHSSLNTGYALSNLGRLMTGTWNAGYTAVTYVATSDINSFATLYCSSANSSDLPAGSQFLAIEAPLVVNVVSEPSTSLLAGRLGNLGGASPGDIVIATPTDTYTASLPTFAKLVSLPVDTGTPPGILPVLSLGEAAYGSETEVDAGDYTLYQIQDFLNPINAAFAAAFAVQKLIGGYTPASAPFVTFNAATNLFVLNTVSSYDTSTFPIYLNAPLQGRFRFPLTSPMYDLVTPTVMYQVYVTGTQVQSEMVTLAQWADIARVLVYTDRLSVKGDSELAATVVLALTDVVPNMDGGLQNDLIYQPNFIRWYQLKNTTPLQSFGISLKYVDKQDKSYDIPIVPGEYWGIKLCFQKPRFST